MSTLKLFLLSILLGFISVYAGAAPNEISHRTESLWASSGQGDPDKPTELARTEIVTVVADSNSDADVERAYTTAATVAEAMEAGSLKDSTNKTLVEISNPNLASSSRAKAALENLKSRFRAAQSKSFELARSTAEAMATLAADPAAPVRYVYNSAKNNPYKTTLFVIKFVSATSAAAVSIIAVNGLPATSFQGVEMIARAMPTGLMSALMVSYADLYTDFVIRPAFFAKHVDDSKWLAAIVRGVQKPFTKGKKFKEFPLKVGLYFDQLIKSLSLEFPFVYISTMFTSSIAAANASMMHILENVFKGGAGQMFFDQAIAIISESMAERVKAQYPEGSPEREAKLASIKRYRDAGMVSNSLFQVWAVLLSAKGYSLASTAVQAYAIGGVLARVAVIPLENKLLRTARENSAPAMCRLLFAR